MNTVTNTVHEIWENRTCAWLDEVVRVGGVLGGVGSGGVLALRALLQREGAFWARVVRWEGAIGSEAR